MMTTCTPPSSYTSASQNSNKNKTTVTSPAKHCTTSRETAFTPQALALEKPTWEPEIQLEHICNGVVHPITQETVTKDEKLANDPHLKATWTKAMCKELGWLAQGYGDKKGTNTVFFMTHDEI